MHIYSELDNPIWSSLQSRHRHLAHGDDTARAFPADYAPFVGVCNDDVDTAELATLVSVGARVFLLGVAPRIQKGWTSEALRPLAQMTCDVMLPIADGPDIVPLDRTHRPDVLALTALVYPHYFRERTMELGRYFGMYRDGRLAAMIGERLATNHAQEISAICTHPDFAKLGYARRLLAFLTNDLLNSGRSPFLHVSHENGYAKQLYEKMGYAVRRDIGFWSLRRDA